MYSTADHVRILDEGDHKNGMRIEVTRLADRCWKTEFCGRSFHSDAPKANRYVAVTSFSVKDSYLAAKAAMLANTRR